MWLIPEIEGIRPAPRGGHCVCSVGSKLIIFGGSDRAPVSYDDLWVLDTGRYSRKTLVGVRVYAMHLSVQTAFGLEHTLLTNAHPLCTRPLILPALCIAAEEKMEWTRISPMMEAG